MKISYHTDYEAMSQLAAELVITEISAKKNTLLCAATGNSPTGLYQKMIEKKNSNPDFFDHLQIIKLDEWGEIPMDSPETCEYYIQTKILEPLEIGSDRYITFQSTSENHEKECQRVQNELNEKGPIDLCILGVGKNGHLGFNEPADFLQSGCHVAQLSQKSMQHSMVQSLENAPTFGLTLGMKDILSSKQIVLLITGEGKKTIIEELLSTKISTQNPASLLLTHPNVYCLIDKDAV